MRFALPLAISTCEILVVEVDKKEVEKEMWFENHMKVHSCASLFVEMTTHSTKFRRRNFKSLPNSRASNFHQRYPRARSGYHNGHIQKVFVLATVVKNRIGFIIGFEIGSDQGAQSVRRRMYIMVDLLLARRINQFCLRLIARPASTFRALSNT